ncbi:universal stress protein [Micromonospora sp. CPCC 206061]|uniref:universal stress protein n=1 Tax=Micromonospora sp. CPCC 206061 TaxID=3122410 RepID=UPI002FF18681
MARLLVELAERADSDALVRGNRGHGPLESLVGGSVASRLLQLAPYPVILVPFRPPNGTSPADSDPAGGSLQEPRGA